ncbi:MAG: hypothetical protein IPH53_07505 [Flavobacteriales bacterium]|nr:hypothetical protein [Flavobacteriales bacterium]
MQRVSVFCTTPFNTAQRILRYALFAGSLSLHVGVKAQYWNQRANLPDTTYAPYGFSVGDRVFMGSGVRSLAPFAENTGFNEYLPVSDSWVPRSPCPGPARHGVGGFSLKRQGLWVCGWSGSPSDRAERCMGV